MKIVIDIDEEDYTFFKDGYSHLKIKEHLTDTRDNRNYISIANGTPLTDVLDKIKSEFVSLYPKNYAGEPELGGSSCEFSLNRVLKIIDKYKTEI